MDAGGENTGCPASFMLELKFKFTSFGFVLDPSSCVCPVASKTSVFPLIFEVVIGERARIAMGPEVLLQQGRGVATLAWGLAAQERQGGELKAGFMFHPRSNCGRGQIQIPYLTELVHKCLSAKT